MCVLPVVLQGAPPGGEKNTNSRFLRFFVRSVPLFRSVRFNCQVTVCTIEVFINMFKNRIDTYLVRAGYT